MKTLLNHTKSQTRNSPKRLRIIWKPLRNYFSFYLINSLKPILFILFILPLYLVDLHAQEFTEQTGISLTGIADGSVAWGDYDNDGDLDIILSGGDPVLIKFMIYQNNGDNTFTKQTGIVLSGTKYGSVEWGDYDNDGDLDILISGYTEGLSYEYVSKIYKNNGDNSFTEQTGISLIGVVYGTAIWGDFDNDGDLDIFLTGDTGSGYVSKIYKNNSDNSFTEQTGISLTEVYACSADWGDYDNDGDLDLLLTGETGVGKVSKIYKNNEDNTFTEQTGISLTGVSHSSVAWGDYDNDGDLDILLTGHTGSGYVSKIYKNNGDNSFVEQTGISLTGVSSSSVAWGDYDNDGDLDILLTGTGSDRVSKIYQNNGDNTFTEQTGISLTGVEFGSVAWGDYDNDGDLDILLAGTSSEALEAKIYKNNSTVSNTVPSAPTGLTAAFAADSVVLSWNKGTDNETPQNGLSYNAYLYSENGDTIWSSMAEINTGYRRIPSIGNVQHDTTWVIKGLDPNYLQFWSVQTIDHAFSGSVFAEEQSIYGQQFEEQTGIIFTGIEEGIVDGSVAWGDYDNDGDLDILVTGDDDPGQVSQIYKNNGDNTFAEQTGISLTGVRDCSVAWGDYDNDGDLDILLTGNYNGNPLSKIYRNNGDNTFTEQSGISLTGVLDSSAAWGDYDNDGDLDILLTGLIDNWIDGVSKIYKNNGDNTFTEQIGISLTGVMEGSVAWGDYDSDRDLDILLTGDTGSGSVSKIYKNNGNNTFTEQTGISLTEVSYSSVAWGDYDNDGDLDILLTGNNNGNPLSKIYKNNGDNTFTEQIGISLTGVMEGSVAWGDYDNDGDLDILLTGNIGTGLYGQGGHEYLSKIYRNNGDNTFAAVVSLTRVVASSVAWGDYDNDGDLDILLTGESEKGEIIKIYKNNSTVLNSAPSAPTGLIAVCAADTVKLSWNKATDNETPQDGLSYNAYLYSENGDTIWSSMADISSGFRKIPSLGNTNQNTSWTINMLKPGTYFWSVQAIDHNLAGSSFASEASFNNEFTELSEITLTGVHYSSSAWGDYDNDRDLDVLITGWSSEGLISGLFENNGDNTFSKLPEINFPEIYNGSVVWGDYDNDGDLDVLLCGNSTSGEYSAIYKNNGDDTFTESGISLAGVSSSSAAWGDYDNDGDLDILLTGLSDGVHVSEIYKNKRGDSFQLQQDISLTGVSKSSSAWGDYDNDGDLDILLTGLSNEGRVSKIYNNNGNNILQEQSGILLTGIQDGSVAWGDYDNDGDLDIILAGLSDEGQVSKIYKNNGDNTFQEQSGIVLIGVQNGSVALGDYDNDGDLDILLTGDSSEGVSSKIYKNDGGDNFTEQTRFILPGVKFGSAIWGDYDNDGDLDILFTGESSGGDISRIYTNNSLISNTVPLAPSSLSNLVKGNSATLNWDKSTDSETPQDGLTYNAYLYSETGDTLWSSHSNNISGLRKIPAPGNAQQNTNWTINDLIPGLCYWSVQAIDQVFAGSVFAPKDSFRIESFISQDMINLTGISDGSVQWGDYDSDDDLDILLAGYYFDGSDHYVTKIYENDGSGDFNEDLSISLPGTRYSSLAWCDYNNDGQLDIILTGLSQSGRISKVYKNTGSGSFIEATSIILPVVSNGSVTAGDYNNDGYQDILLTGNTGSGKITKIYQNNKQGNFIEESSIMLPGVENGTAQWSDYDNDADLDILLTGNSDGGQISKIFKNEGDGIFTEQSSVDLTGVSFSSSDWGDYDSDGNLDILITGLSGSDKISKVYKNNGDGSFTEQVLIGLEAVQKGSSAWGDFDNDGDLDILITGLSDTGEVALIYQNEGANIFILDPYHTLQNVQNSSVACGDYDQDGDLDVLLTGSSGSSYIARIYKNNALPLNTPPQPPSGLSASTTGRAVEISWNKASDNETMPTGLNYNVYLYKEGGDTIISPLSRMSTGFRKVSALGNVQADTICAVDLLEYGRYCWSVQTIDNSFIGSGFADEDSFEISTPLPVASGQSVCFEDPVPDLTATGENIKWYSDAELQTLEYSGTPFATGKTESGSYTYFVTQTIDDYESKATEVVLTIKPLPSSPVASDKDLCFGDTDPADLAATGTDLKWYNDASLTNLVGTGSVLATGLSAVGIYTYFVTQTENSCEGKPDTVTLTINSLPGALVMNDETICASESHAFNIGSPAVAGHSYAWSSIPAGFSSSEANPAVTPTMTTTYIMVETITVTGCENTNSVTITINPNPVVSITAGQNPIEQNSSTPLDASGASTYQWSPATGLSSTTESQVTADPDEITTYVVEGTNSFGCTGTDTIILYVYCKECSDTTYFTAMGNFNFGCTNNLYKNSLNCSWTIFPSGVDSIYLNFKSPFDIKEGDYIRVYNGSNALAPLIGSYNNDNLPPVLISSGSIMFIQFITDDHDTGIGFQARWSNDPGFTGTDDISQDRIKIYPNPANDKLFIEINDLTGYDLRLFIYNHLGQMILNRQLEYSGSQIREELDISDFKAGMYLIRILTSEDIYIKKVIKE